MGIHCKTCLAGAMLISAAHLACAQPAVITAGAARPVKALRIIMSFPAGDTSGILARLPARKFTATWHQQIVVDGRAGAYGSIGTDRVVRSPPDGYPLLLTDVGGLMISPAVYLEPGHKYSSKTDTYDTPCSVREARSVHAQPARFFIAAGSAT